LFLSGDRCAIPQAPRRTVSFGKVLQSNESRNTVRLKVAHGALDCKALQTGPELVRGGISARGLAPCRPALRNLMVLSSSSF
jgi:hypothetical protein